MRTCSILQNEKSDNSAGDKPTAPEAAATRVKLDQTAPVGESAPAEVKKPESAPDEGLCAGYGCQVSSTFPNTVLIDVVKL